jgi:hypothetical protein
VVLFIVDAALKRAEEIEYFKNGQSHRGLSIKKSVEILREF